LDQALAEVERLKASQQEKAVTELKDKLAKAEAAAKQAADDVAALKAGAEKAKADAEAAVAAVKAELAAAQAKLADAGKTIQEKSDELQGLYAAKTKAERLAAVKDKLKFDDEAADAFLATVAGLSKDQFDKQIDILSKAVSVAQKATQAPTAPKATDAPTHGKAGAEADEAGEEAAAGTEVKADETGKTGAAVSTTEATDGVKNINKAVAAFFGCDDEEAAK
jgi:chromosome segregation ATPase